MPTKFQKSIQLLSFGETFLVLGVGYYNDTFFSISERVVKSDHDVYWPPFEKAIYGVELALQRKANQLAEEENAN